MQVDMFPKYEIKLNTDRLISEGGSRHIFFLSL